MNMVCIIGYGYWGKILHRTVYNHPDFQVRYICDRHSDNQAYANQLQSDIQFISDPSVALSDTSINLVIIATQPENHFLLCQAALNANKNVFVEKPITLQSSHAKILYDLAQKKNKKIWIDHTFLFTGTYEAVKKTIQNNVIGHVKRWHSTRSIVGAFSKPVDMIWDLLVHDLYILIDLFGIPIAVDPIISASTMYSHCKDTLIAGFIFSNGLHATIHCDRLFHSKKREIVIAGTMGTLVWDEMKEDKILRFHHQKQSAQIATSFVSQYEQPEKISYHADEALSVEMSALSAFLKTEKTLFFPDQRTAIFIIELLENLSVNYAYE